MGMFGEDRIDELMKNLDRVEGKLNKLIATVEAIKEVDTVAIIKSVQASFNGIRSENQNNINRIHNLVVNEFDKRLGETEKVEAKISKKDRLETKNRKSRNMKTVNTTKEPEMQVYLGDEDE